MASATTEHKNVTDSVMRFGAVPHPSAGAELSRGARRHSCQGAALISPRAPVAHGATGIAAGRYVGGAGREYRRSHQTQRVSPLNPIRATHPVKSPSLSILSLTPPEDRMTLVPAVATP